MTYVVQIAIIDQLHDQKYVDEQLGFRMLHNLRGSFICAMEFLFHLDPIIQRSGLAWKLKSVEKVEQVVLQNEYSV